MHTVKFPSSLVLGCWSPQLAPPLSPLQITPDLNLPHRNQSMRMHAQRSLPLPVWRMPEPPDA